MTSSRLSLLVLLFALFAAGPTSAVGDSARDIAVAANTFKFVSPAISNARVAVVHNGGASLAEAQRIVRSMPRNVRRIGISATPVSVSQLRSSNANVVLLAPSLSGAALSSVRSALAGGRKLCVTTQRRHVESGACVMAVSSSPRVRIIVNNAAARHFGVRFASALMMMVDQI